MVDERVPCENGFTLCTVTFILNFLTSCFFSIDFFFSQSIIVYDFFCLSSTRQLNIVKSNQFFRSAVINFDELISQFLSDPQL